MARVKALRQNLAQQLGFIVPPVHITDNVRLQPREYVIALRGIEVARWEMYQDQLMAISSEGAPRPLAGTLTEKAIRSGLQPPEFYDEAYATVHRDGYWSGTSWNRRTVVMVDEAAMLDTKLMAMVTAHAHDAPLYFESSALVITFVLLGKWLEGRESVARQSG